MSATEDRLALVVVRLEALAGLLESLAAGAYQPQWSAERRALLEQMWVAGAMPKDIRPRLAALPGPPPPSLSAILSYARGQFGARKRATKGGAA